MCIHEKRVQKMKRERERDDDDDDDAGGGGGAKKKDYAKTDSIAILMLFSFFNNCLLA